MAHIASSVKGFAAALAGSALALTAFVAPANAEARTDGQIIQPTSGTTQINLIGFNDFHGRITKVDALAGAVLTAKDAYGADNTVVVGVGDQFGASEFESSVAGDQPSKDALKALGVDAYTAGNHEFDKGQDDAVAIKNEMGNLLAANVKKADGSLLLDPYKIVTAGGQRVAIIGAVTSSTPSAVSPSGIEGLTFSNPVDAVNEYADILTDGDEANGEADILVASYHEGGPGSGSYDENAANDTFNQIATGTSPKVSAIFNAHTHQKYNYEAAIGDTTRPIVQAASYADAIGQIVLTVDEAGKVVKADSSVIETFADKTPIFLGDGLTAESKATYDDVLKVKNDAIAQAKVLGAEQVGVVNEDITRAYLWADGNAGKDDRAQESTLGGVVADSMYTWANNVGTDATKADLAIMNPGGLRADIDGDGVLTYKDAQTVLPFVNNLAVVTIKGEHLKEVFEQQWQRDANGEVPSRPYLQLGMSSNVNYSYDATRDEGSRITSIYIDGKPLDPAASYKVVMPTFLASGGDNFHSLTKAENVYDTGSVDLDAFIEYVKSLPNQELKPENTRNGFEITNYFDGEATPEVKPGDEKTFTVSDVDLHSKGLILNDKIEVKLNGEVIGEQTLSGGTKAGQPNMAEVTITIPADLADGDYTIDVVAQKTGSTVNLPLRVKAETPEPTNPAQDTPKVSVDKTTVSKGEKFTITATGFRPNEEITFEMRSTPVALGSAVADADGSATVEATTPTDIESGEHTVAAKQGDTEATTPITVVDDDDDDESKEPFIVVKESEYTETESKKGIEWIAGNFQPGTAQGYLIDPTGKKQPFTVEVDDDGYAANKFTWASYDQAGNLVENNLPFPVGDYVLVIQQGDKSATVEFKVIPDESSATFTVSTTDENGGSQLAATGADAPFVMGVALAAAAVIAAGAVLTLRRQRDA